MLKFLKVNLDKENFLEKLTIWSGVAPNKTPLRK